MTEDALIGIDVGTGAVKAILIGLDGNVLATFSQPYPTSRPRSGFVEQWPEDWMEGLLKALTAFASAIDPRRVAGIGLSSQVNTHVFVDAAGDPLLPAIVWQDTRCGGDAATLDSRISPTQKARWFGGPMPIDASNALSRMAWVARVRPDIYRRTRYVLLPKDFCALRLSGAVSSDPISAVGLVDTELAYVIDLIAMIPGAAERLPALHAFTHRAGTVREGLPCAGVPIFTGTMDAWAGMFGVGAVRDGNAMYLSGTSEVPGLISSRHVPTPGVIVFPPYEGIRLHVAPTQSGGAALAWLSTLLNRSADDLSALVAATPPSDSVPIFLPHLQGERAPLWDVKSRGVFARIETASGPGELARAVFEGVAFSARLAFEASERSAGLKVNVLNLGGGGARSDIWCQIRADVFGRTMQRVKTLDAGTLGAAMIAGVGAKAMPSIPAAADRLVAIDRTFAPDSDRSGYYDARFARYQELYATLKPFNDDH
jgi:xylulokinase